MPLLQNGKQLGSESITETTRSKQRQQPKSLSKANSHRCDSSSSGCICEFCRLKFGEKCKNKTNFGLEALTISSFQTLPFHNASCLRLAKAAVVVTVTKSHVLAPSPHTSYSPRPFGKFFRGEAREQMGQTRPQVMAARQQLSSVLPGARPLPLRPLLPFPSLGPLSLTLSLSLAQSRHNQVAPSATSIFIT